MYAHPGGGHPAEARVQIQSMQLWLAHKFFGMPLPEVALLRPQIKDERIVFTCEIGEPDGVETVELSYALYEERQARIPKPDERPLFWSPATYGPHTKAKWKSVEMEDVGGYYSASIPVLDLEKLHYTVRARVTKGHVSGYLSSPVYIAKQSLGASE